ncbi:hypothetical protein FALBO_10748 [Fusarium albosuccineum]|uniref:Cytochrome c domain-containing protein n=1 Tax=Fusarium albosuccineum TaxID=1237068 RepID=A0A8H4L790_9HYPO|nr:hypothetical protein FALBO_10748 [Fusarium albosuccineum]
MVSRTLDALEPTPKGELADTQKRELQTWACGFYNEIGAATFGEIWKDPSKPKWENVKFQLGTCVFKILLTDATNLEVPIMDGSPTMHAVISPNGAINGAVRQDHASPVRLLQVDFAVRDDRADIGWVFGTFMYNGHMKDANPWDRLIPVGIMWGNDTELTPARAAEGAKPTQSWINRDANDIRKSLKGSRPSWGWLGRLNGPADNFRSACASCHSVSERDPKEKVQLLPPSGATDAEKMRWFRNIPAGKPFNKGGVSGDYSLQLMMGYNNFRGWSNPQRGFVYKVKLIVPFSNARYEAEIIESARQPLRSSPEDRGQDNKN